MMNEPIEIELIPDDEPEEDEGTIDAEELFSTLMEGFQHSQKWHDGSGTVRHTQIIDGERIGPINVTKSEYAQLQCELGARDQQHEVTAIKPEAGHEEAA